jgi:hypothetical protein
MCHGFEEVVLIFWVPKAHLCYCRLLAVGALVTTMIAFVMVIKMFMVLGISGL